MSTTAVLRHLVATVAVPAALFTACAATQGQSGVMSAYDPPPGMHPDTKAAPGECQYYNYYHDESKNPAGAGKCAEECDCDGMRTCRRGVCDGAARPRTDCNDANRRWNEAWNPLGPGKCSTDCDCDGTRTCHHGECEGGAR